MNDKDSEIDADPRNSSDGDGYETGPIVNILLCLEEHTEQL